tara:strand:- start:777 stop:1163 length:387 start_codon:yes stop_codon:yes gene_type:complete
VNKFLKKIIAQSSSDLQIISACCSESKVKLSEMKYLKENQIFLISLLRKNVEEGKNKENIYSVIKFEYILSSKSKNINQYNRDDILNLLAIDIYKKENNYEIILLFSENAIITLTAEIIEVTLEDQKK